MRIVQGRSEEWENLIQRAEAGKGDTSWEPLAWVAWLADIMGKHLDVEWDSRVDVSAPFDKVIEATLNFSVGLHGRVDSVFSAAVACLGYYSEHGDQVVKLVKARHGQLLHLGLLETERGPIIYGEFWTNDPKLPELTQNAIFGSSVTPQMRSQVETTDGLGQG